jgi:hypothetical protein
MRNLFRQEKSLAGPLTEPQARSLGHVLGAIKRRCEDAGVPVVLVYLSRIAGVRFAGVRSVAEALGIEVIDTAPAFRDTPFNDTTILPIDGHPNPLAHRLYADAVYAHLRERLDSARPAAPRAARIGMLRAPAAGSRRWHRKELGWTRGRSRRS